LSLTPGDADQRQILLKEKGLADYTIRRFCGRAKQLFRAAVRRKLINEIPFSDMKDTAVRANRQWDYFVTREEEAKVLEACPYLDACYFAAAEGAGARHRPIRRQEL
jgi:hypothetical protein